MFRKSLMALLVGGVLMGGVIPSFAERRGCEERVRRAEENLRQAERRHGNNTKQVEKRRRELEKARQNCRVDEHRDRDHDRDRDQHDRH